MNEDSANFAKSDDLVMLQQLLEHVLPNPSFQLFVKFKIIVDANVILKDIKYLLTKVKKANARTGFLEILEAQAIECFAPTYLMVEIKSKIPVLAKKYNFSKSEAFELWKRFSKHIIFIDTGGPNDAESNSRDPKDIPYIRLQDLLKHPIVTNDSDIAGMGGVTTNITIIASLRDYARESANSLTILTGSGFAFAIPIVLISKAASFMSIWIGKNVPRPPRWFWFMGVILVAGILIYPPSRIWIKSKLSALSLEAKNAFESLYSLAAPAIESFENSHSKAKEAMQNVQDQITI